MSCPVHAISKFISSVKFPSSDGMFPTMFSFHSIFKVVSDDSDPISVGKVPPIVDLLNSNLLRFCKFPISAGRVPTRSVFRRVKAVNCVIFQITVGIVPVKAALSLSEFNLSRFPISEGIVPPIPPLESIRNWVSDVICPISEGSTPLIMSSFLYIMNFDTSLHRPISVGIVPVRFEWSLIVIVLVHVQFWDE